MDLVVEKIVIKLDDGRKLELTPDEAKNLRDALIETVGPHTPTIIPVYIPPYPPYPVYPPLYYRTPWTCTDTTISIASETSGGLLQ